MLKSENLKKLLVIMLAVILLGTIVIAAFSGFVGEKLLKKQFEKAGITA